MSEQRISGKKLDSFHASRILEAHDIDSLMMNDEEWQLLVEHNPELAAAYLWLRAVAEKP
jgi:hypothetical protein